jgi:hypothetical protein
MKITNEKTIPFASLASLKLTFGDEQAILEANNFLYSGAGIKVAGPVAGVLPSQKKPFASSISLPTAPGFLLTPGGNPKMHNDVNTLHPPDTREKYSKLDIQDFGKKPEELRKMAHDGQRIARAAQLRYPLAGALLLHYFQGSGSARQINMPKDSRSSVTPIDSAYGNLRKQNIEVAKEFFKTNPSQETITIRSPWSANQVYADRSADLALALNNFHFSTVSTITAVKDPNGKIIGLRERSTGAISDFYDFSFSGIDLETPLGNIRREDLWAMGHPDVRAAKGFPVFGFTPLTNATSMIRWFP